MFTSGTNPPSGINESCIAFTAPQLASVVIVAKSAEFAIPNRTSFPSMFPPACMADARWLTCIARCVQQRIRLRLGIVRNKHSCEKQRAHRSEDGPAVGRLLGHPSERHRQVRQE